MRGFALEHQGHEVKLSGIVLRDLCDDAVRAVCTLLPGRDPVVCVDVPEWVIFRTDAIRTAESFLDDVAQLRDCHKAIPVGQHFGDRSVDILDE